MLRFLCCAPTKRCESSAKPSAKLAISHLAIRNCSSFSASVICGDVQTTTKNTDHCWGVGAHCGAGRPQTATLSLFVMYEVVCCQGLSWCLVCVWSQRFRGGWESGGASAPRCFSPLVLPFKKSTLIAHAIRREIITGRIFVLGN